MSDNALLPTDDLKKYGIIQEDNSFSKKLSEDDIQKFLDGHTIVADNKKNRMTFQLTENNTKLDVKIFERDNNLDKILENSKQEIQYVDLKELDLENRKSGNLTKKAFLLEEKDGKTTVTEYDMIKNSKELTKKVEEIHKLEETNRYQNELKKLQSHLQDKIDKFPDIAKDILVDLNVVSNALKAVNSFSQNQETAQKQKQSKVELKVDDPDMFQDANRTKEEKQVEEQEQQKSRGFRR